MRPSYGAPSLAHRGASPETVRWRSKVWRPAAAARNRRLGRHGNRPPGTTTRATRSSLHVLRRQCRSRKRGTGAENRQGGASRGVRPGQTGRAAPHQRGVAPCKRDDMKMRHSALRPPRSGWVKEGQRPGATAPRKRMLLFEIVIRPRLFKRPMPSSFWRTRPSRISLPRDG
jgi:hypothetical protein